MVSGEDAGYPGQDGHWDGSAPHQHPWKRGFAALIFFPCWFKYVFFSGLRAQMHHAWRVHTGLAFKFFSYIVCIPLLA